MIEYLLKTYTDEGDLVLDNAAGSFTTGIGCMNLNRNYVMIEKDVDEFNNGMRRISLKKNL